MPIIQWLPPLLIIGHRTDQYCEGMSKGGDVVVASPCEYQAGVLASCVRDGAAAEKGPQGSRCSLGQILDGGGDEGERSAAC